MNSKLCPVCGSGNTSKELKANDPRNLNIKNKFEYLRCGNCKSLFLTGVNYNRKYYEDSYGTDYYENGSKKIITLKDKLEKIFSIYTNAIKWGISKKYLKAGKKVRLLDIGSGDQMFLKSLVKEDFKISAIDLNKPEKIEKGINFIEGDFLKYNFGKQRFDIVTSWHVIEHIPEPKQFLLKINKITASQGIVVLSTPDTDGFGYGLTKKYWYHLDAPRHTVLFNKGSLKHLAEKTGFEVINLYKPRFEFPFDLLKSLKRAGKFPITFLFPLLKSVKSETMIVVLRKL